MFQGPLGGEPRIGAGVRWDAAIGLLANGQAVFFDALNPGVVPLRGVAVRIAGNEISATVPLALLPSQGACLKDVGRRDSDAPRRIERTAREHDSLQQAACGIDALFFSAGPQGGRHGLVGRIDLQ